MQSQMVARTRVSNRRCPNRLLQPRDANEEGNAMHFVAAEDSLKLVAAIVLAAIILYELRTEVVALNNSERYYTAFTLVLATAVVCIAVLSRGSG